MKEKLVNYVDEVADKVQNVGQCKMAASAVNGLTEGDISMKTRVTIDIYNIYKKNYWTYENIIESMSEDLIVFVNWSEWLSECVSEWASAWVTERASASEWMVEWVFDNCLCLI